MVGMEPTAVSAAVVAAAGAVAVVAAITLEAKTIDGKVVLTLPCASLPQSWQTSATKDIIPAEAVAVAETGVGRPIRSRW